MKKKSSCIYRLYIIVRKEVSNDDIRAERGTVLQEIRPGATVGRLPVGIRSGWDQRVELFKKKFRAIPH